MSSGTNNTLCISPAYRIENAQPERDDDDGRAGRNNHGDSQTYLKQKSQ